MTNVHRTRSLLKAPVALLLILTALLAVACGDDEEPAAPSAAATTTEEAAAAFPVTVEHKYGTTEIPEPPERVVTVGLNEQDAFIALGTVPVGVTDWMGFENGIAPWTEENVGSAERPELLVNTDGIEFEKVAALRPDVIVGLYSDLTKGDYEKLSQIAPTVAPPEGHADFGIPFEDTTRTVGKILGKEAEAKELVDAIDGRFEKIRADHPEFGGKTATMAMSYQGLWAYGPDDPRSRLLTNMGFELSPELSKLFVNDFAGKLSDERVDLLDLDAIVWVGEEAELEKLKRNSLYTSLAVHEEGREVFVPDSRPDKAYNAIGFQTVLSIPLSLDVLVPALAAALDDDPETTPEG